MSDNLFSDLMPNLRPDESELWEQEWQDMPEFTQQELDAEFSVNVNFKNEADMLAFSQLVGQKIRSTTRSIWYPEQKFDVVKNLRYITE